MKIFTTTKHQELHKNDEGQCELVETTSINNWIFVLAFIILIAGVELSDNIPAEEEPTYSHVVCT